jgi:hypothetical protein
MAEIARFDYRGASPDRSEKQSISWLPNTWPENGMQFEARFARKDCTPCSLRPLCTRAKNEPQIIGLEAHEHYEALQSARSIRRRRRFSKDTLHAPGSKLRTHRQSVAAGCGDADI